MLEFKSWIRSNSSRLLLLLGCLMFAFVLTSVIDTAIAQQVSESELSSLERSAAIQRQAERQPSPAAKADINFFALLAKGGAFMIPLGVMSVIVVTIIFDRLIGLRTGRILPGRFRKALTQSIRQNDMLDPRAIYRLCQEMPSSAATIVQAVILKTGRPQSEIQTTMTEITQREANRAYANVRWLNLAAGIGPLMGLLGTVWGLIRAFHDLSKLTANQNRADFLAAGIYEALITTLAGLMVAIPASLASHYFEGRVTKLFGYVEDLLEALLPRLERFEGKTRFEAIGRELVARDVGTSTPPPVSTSPSSLIPEPPKSRPTVPRMTK